MSDNETQGYLYFDYIIYDIRVIKIQLLIKKHQKRTRKGIDIKRIYIDISVKLTCKIKY